MRVCSQRSWLLGVALCSAALASACGASGPSADASVPGADGAVPDGGGGLGDASAIPPQPGEGTACRFTTECGPLQMCLDDACIRHERVRPEDITYGEFRLARAGETGNPFNGVPAAGLMTIQNTQDPNGWIVPGAHGPELVASIGFASRQSCVILRVGDDEEFTVLEGTPCAHAFPGPDGTFLVDLREGEIALVEKTGAIRWRRSVPDALNQQAQMELGTDVKLGPLNSALFHDGAFYASFGLATAGGGTYRFVSRAQRPGEITSPGVALTRIALDGATTQALSGTLTIRGRRGFLVRDDMGLSALVTNRTSATEPVFDLSMVAVPSGATTSLAGDLFEKLSVSQPGATAWAVVAYSQSDCLYRIRDRGQTLSASDFGTSPPCSGAFGGVTPDYEDSGSEVPRFLGSGGPVAVFTGGTLSRVALYSAGAQQIAVSDDQPLNIGFDRFTTVARFARSVEGVARGAGTQMVWYEFSARRRAR